jgi:pyruvate kinase
MRRYTKIVATIGPASSDKHTIRTLIQSGMNVARLNFSHGNHEYYKKVIQTIRDESDQLGQAITILQDLQGPKIRTGKLLTEQINLEPGKTFILCTDPKPGTAERVSVDFKELPDHLKPGSRILLADGHMELAVRECSDTEITTEIIIGGKLKSHQGVNLPGTSLNIPGFTAKDRIDLEFGLSQGVDMIALSFVRTAKDIMRVRTEIARLSPDRIRTPIIAKLERPEALVNLHEIVEAADGVMVARGDLGVELPPEEVPIAQKEIIAAANKHAKIVITATQMLESMMENPRPTRAEASDVANAIFDGSDAVMLSGETAIGKYPIGAVQMMDAIIRKAEENLPQWGHWKGHPEEPATHSDAIYLSRAAAALAEDRHVAGIAVFTKSGSTALLMSKTRPDVPILGFTSDPKTYQRMSLFWGVISHLVPRSKSMEQLIDHVESGLLAETPVERGQQVVLICGFPVDEMRPSNLVMLHTVGQRS